MNHFAGEEIKLAACITNGFDDLHTVASGNR